MIEAQASSSACKSSSDSPDCEMIEIPPTPEINQHTQDARLIPRFIEKERNSNAYLDTPYKKYLAASLLNSTNPNGEKMMHFSSATTKKKHPYDPSIHNPPPDSIKHPVCTLKNTILAEGLADNYYHQALAYNQNQDCLAIIVDSSVFLRKENEWHHLPLDSISGPTAIAFNPEGNALLVSMIDGSLLCYKLTFDHSEVSSEVEWESNILSTPGYRQCNRLLITESFIFIGTGNGRICRISKSNPEDFCFYETSHDESIANLAVTPDGKSLLTTNGDGIITLYDVDNPRPLHQIKALQSARLVLSPCGRFFVGGGGYRDPEIALFSIENQRIQKINSYHMGSQTTALFWHNDFIISTNSDGAIHTFSVNPNHLFHISPPRRHETPAYGHRITYAALKHNKSSDVLFVASPASDRLYEIELKTPHLEREAPPPFSRYSTIR